MANSPKLSKQRQFFLTKTFFFFISASFQYVGIPISFLSLALSSTKLFFSQRLGRFTDVDPAFTHWITLLPIVSVQIMGPLLSLVLMAAYFRLYIFACIGGIVLINSLVLAIFVFKCGCPPDKDLEDLHKRSKYGLFSIWVSVGFLEAFQGSIS